ncbi:MAG: thiamine pyrophosphate-binding protein [Candidatus Sumerlaeota bacterium]|nr:thiamine pyrophosphate-binding protein [Candidatus Sumerlaeota bacterium]
MKASDYIAQFLTERGVAQVFVVSGGMITHMLDSFSRRGAPRVISMRHEQSAGFAAETVGRITGLPGVALATSGPGATNLLTAIGSCYFDSSPAVFITGQVNRNELKRGRDVRQAGFQETDIVSMARPITKAAWMIDNPALLPEQMTSAFKIATGGRPGPVLLDIPMDVQRSDIAVPAEGDDAPETAEASLSWLASRIEEILTSLRAARRPLILAGGGVRCARVVDLFRQFARAVQTPVVNSLLAVDVMPCDDPLRVGLIGTYGNRWANLALGACDWLLVLGSRLDVRQTGSDAKAFAEGRAIYHVDVQVGEMNHRVKGCNAIHEDLRRFLPLALRMAGERPFEEKTDWMKEIGQLRRRWPDVAEQEGLPGINPNRFIRALCEASRQAAVYAVDVGQHQMWAAQSAQLDSGQRFLTSGGMGSMGFALPASVGAALACAPRPVVVIAGDGGMQHNIQELQTIAHHRLPIKIVVINNGSHGMVRQFQESYFESRFEATVWGYSAPDFVKVAEAYGIPAIGIEKEEDVARGIEALWRDPAAPALLQVMVDKSANAYPKIAFGRPVTEMEPQAKPVEMEGT